MDSTSSTWHSLATRSFTDRSTAQPPAACWQPMAEPCTRHQAICCLHETEPCSRSRSTPHADNSPGIRCVSRTASVRHHSAGGPRTACPTTACWYSALVTPGTTFKFAGPIARANAGIPCSKKPTIAASHSHPTGRGLRSTAMKIPSAAASGSRTSFAASRYG